MKIEEAINFIHWAEDVFYVTNTSKKANIEFIGRGNQVIKLLQEGEENRRLLKENVKD